MRKPSVANAGSTRDELRDGPRRRPTTGKGGAGRTALVLAGGGITGGVYQVGVLRALDDLLVNRTTLDFDLYVGTSAGSFVATLLAIGIPPRAVAEAALNPGLGLQWKLMRHVFSPNLGEFGTRLLRLPAHVPAFVTDLVRHRGNFLFSDLIGFLSLALPSGLLDSSQLSRFMRDILELADMPVEFGDLERELHVVATRLDTWERVVFGAGTRPAVSIPDAVAASSAIPIVFRPVRIGGQDYVDGGAKGAAAVDVAIARGAELIVVVNALAPLDVRGVKQSSFLHRFGRSISDLGIRGVANQIARGILHDTLADHIRLLRQRHPNVDIVLIQPQPNDEKMFFHEVMSTSARLVVAQHGYESVLAGLRSHPDYFRRVLGRHGVEISADLGEDRRWDVPVRAIEEGEMPVRLEETVFGGRRVDLNRKVRRLLRALQEVDDPAAQEAGATAEQAAPTVAGSGTPVDGQRVRKRLRTAAKLAAPRPAAGKPASRRRTSSPRTGR